MTTAADPVTVYSRPGCRYCFRLRHGLRRRGVTFREINIWTDPEAAATVRAAAGGNETVPTVHVAGRWLVNPSAKAVHSLVGAPRGGTPEKLQPRSPLPATWRRGRPLAPVDPPARRTSA